MPYVQFESVGDFIPEPRCSKFAVGLQTRRRKMGGTRGPVGLRSEGPSQWEPRYVLSVRACARGLNLVVLLLCTSELDRSNESESVGRAHPLLWMKGTALQERECERKRVCVLPSLVAHTVGYKKLCRRPQHCWTSDARGRLRRLVRVWQMSVPAILLMPRGT